MKRTRRNDRYLLNLPAACSPTLLGYAPTLLVSSQRLNERIDCLLEVIPHRLKIDCKPDVRHLPVEPSLTVRDHDSGSRHLIFQERHAPLFPHQKRVLVASREVLTEEAAPPLPLAVAGALIQSRGAMEADREELVPCEGLDALLWRQLDSHAFKKAFPDRVELGCRAQSDPSRRLRTDYAPRRRVLAMRMRGLEPPRGCPHTDLNRARLPIPPHPRGRTV